MPDLIVGVGRASHGIIWGPVVVSDNHRVYVKKVETRLHARAHARQTNLLISCGQDRYLA